MLQVQTKCNSTSRSLGTNPREHRMFRRCRPQETYSGYPECQLASLILEPVTWYLFYNKVCFTFMCWVRIVFFKLWNTGINVFLTHVEASPRGGTQGWWDQSWIYYQLTSACPCVKIDLRLLTPGVFLGASKNTVLSYLHSLSTSPCLWFLNFNNTYSSLRYPHYCHDGRV